MSLAHNVLQALVRGQSPASFAMTKTATTKTTTT